MGKYDNLKTLKKTKARTQHVCCKCAQKKKKIKKEKVEGEDKTQNLYLI